ncbi:chitinase [Kocuria sp. M1R5S2]|uniref:chitinase n=1 Tax=Kocuria rhizosphaerae TaxID=3376285 RepID=UPI003799E870
MHGPPRRRRAVAAAMVPVVLGVGTLTSCANRAFQEPWFGSYVDTTAWPTFDFASVVDGRQHIVLGFVVADPQDPCAPSWGGYFGPEEAGQRIDLDRRISAVRDRGGDVVVSFGGAAGDELATVCEDPARLAEAYRSVIDRYGLTTVDLDIEMDDLGRPGANARRAAALASIQEERRKPLDVWLTLPLGPSGLGDPATDVVAQVLEKGVRLSGVNLMTMNYGDGAGDRGVVATTTDAVQAAHDRLGDVWAAAEQPLSDDLLWNRMGITPMIGQNDIRDEVLDQESASRLAEFARERGMGRMSYWSLNRDRPCGDDVQDVRHAVAGCSGIAQEAGEFTRVLRDGFGA